MAKKDEENEELKKKLDEKDEIIIKLKHEIEVQKLKIEEQKEKIEEQNKKIEKDNFIINIYHRQHFHEIKNFSVKEKKQILLRQ